MFASEPSPPQQAPGIIDATLRYRQLTAALTIACLLLGAVYTIFQPKTYTAEGHLVLTDPRGSTTFRDGTSVVDFARYLNERKDFATSGEVLAGTAKAVPKAGSVGDIRNRCSVASNEGGSSLDISCTYDDTRVAIATVDALVKVYRDLTKTQTDTKAQAALDALTPEQEAQKQKLEDLQTAPGGDVTNNAVASATATRLNDLEKRATDIRTTKALFGDGTESYDYARVPPSDSRLKLLLRNSILGGIIGFLIAVLIAWFRADRDPIADSPNEVTGWLELPLLGEIEHRYLQGETIDLTGTPESTFQRVTSNLDAVLQGDTVLFTPAKAIARHEDVVIKTALVAARAGKRVLLIDGDQTGRALSNLLGLPTSAGLAEFIAGDVPADEATVRLSFGKAAGLAASSLYLMGPGGDPGQSPALFRSTETAEALRELKQYYDLILIDGPPLLVSAGASVLGQVVDGIVVMIERGTSRPIIEDSRRQLAFLTGEAIGFVFIHGD